MPIIIGSLKSNNFPPQFNVVFGAKNVFLLFIWRIYYLRYNLQRKQTINTLF